MAYRSMGLTRSLTLLSILVCLSCMNQAVHGKMLTEVPRSLQNLCSDIGKPALQGRKHAKLLSWLLQATSEASLKLKASPQHQAACYAIFQDPMRKKTQSNRAAFRQRYALSVFFIATKGLEAWYPDVGNPNATTSAIKDEGANKWLGNTHECTWYGVRCTANIPFMARTVTGLDITFFGVGGMLPRELALLDSLKEIDLHGNDLQGVLPNMAVVNWKKMESLKLHMNGFFGNLLKEMGAMKNLKELILFGNYFAGTIPRELSKMKKLEVIDLYANQLSGRIPSELANLPKLQRLDLHDNNLVGTMPVEICRRNLPVLVADCLGSNPEVRCDCCTVCCRGLPDMICKDVKTGKKVIPD